MQEEYSPQFSAEVFQVRAFGPAASPASAVRRVVGTRDTHALAWNVQRGLLSISLFLCPHAATETLFIDV